MSDVVDRMAEYAYDAYEQYKSINPKNVCDFSSFAVGYFLGALAASGKRKGYTREYTND